MMEFVYNSFRFVNTFYTPLEPYFAADPLLLLDFVYLCPEDDYPELFKRAPAHVSLAWLSSYRPLPFFSTLVSCWADVKFLMISFFLLKGSEVENMANRDQEKD